MSFTTFFIIGGIIGLIFVVIKQSTISNNKKKIESRLTLLPNFTPSQKFVGKDGLTGIALDEGRKKLCLLTNTPTAPLKLVDYKNILSSAIVEDGNQITKTSRTSQVGGALIGGLALGGIGAVIGGLSGSKKSSNKVNNISIEITINDTVQPIYKISFLDLEVKQGDILYNAAMQEAKHWHSLINVLIKQADAADKEQEVKNNNANDSPIEALSKLADLKEKGFLTDEEFQEQKQRILSKQ